SCRANSRQSHWLNDRPCWAGSSQARRTRCKPTSGGEGPRPSGPWTVTQAGEPFGSKTIDPGPNAIAIEADLLGDAAERPVVGGEQDDPRALHLAGRARATVDPLDERGARVRRQFDAPRRARARHGSNSD